MFAHASVGTILDMPLKDLDARRAYSRAYREKHRATLNAYKRKWFNKRYHSDPEFREKAKEAARTSRPSHVAAAQQRVYYAVKDGRLVRPSACENCGAEGRIEAAHSDYSRPLDVRWLCRRCHREWDSREPKS